MSLTTLTDYYASLLAYQYRGLPNADRQVKLWASQFLAENLAASLLTCFDLDTAVGTQLDVLGKYIGVSRNIGAPTPTPYFGLWTYAETTLLQANYQGTWNPTTNTPTITSATAGHWWVADSAGTATAPVAAAFACGDVLRALGSTSFVNYTDATVYPYGGNHPNGNGLTGYASTGINPNGVFYDYSFAEGQNTLLSDAAYRAVLKLKTINNGGHHTTASITSSLFTMFGPSVAMTDNRNMTMSYIVWSSVGLTEALLLAYLPRPMGVGTTVTIINVNPTPGVGELLVTEDGFTITTEDSDPIITEPT